MKLEEAVAEAVKLLRVKVPDDEILQLLTALGASRTIAQEILIFLPLVYARELLRRSGCSDLPPTFSRRLPDGSKTTPLPLARKPVWWACEAFLKTDIASGSRGDDILIIAARSEEFQSAHAMLNAGHEVPDLFFDPPILNLPEDGPIDEQS
jgi:hypothetical protein